MINLRQIKIFLGSFLFLASSINSALAADDFCGDQQDKAFIYAKIPVTTGGNLRDYLDTNGLSRFATIQDILDATSKIGAATNSNLEKIESYLYALNDYYSYMLKSSSEGIGQMISERLMGEIDNLYFNQTTNNRRLYFSDQPQNSEYGNGFTANGTYSFISEGNVSISLRITRLKDGEIRTFVSSGEPIAATKRLAQRVFEAFQMPGNQGVFNPFSDAIWLTGETTGFGAKMRVKDAVEYCSAFGARLPTKIELLLASKLGPYVTGLKMDDRLQYVATENETVKVFLPATGQCLDVGNDLTKQAMVVCIKNS